MKIKTNVSYIALSARMLSESEDHYAPTLRVLEIERRDATSCGFHLTRSKWDPYPWVNGVDAGSPADAAGVRVGDCLLEVNGEDIVGKRISEVAEVVRQQEAVSLLLWNAGVDVQCSPEVRYKTPRLWCLVSNFRQNLRC